MLAVLPIDYLPYAKHVVALAICIAAFIWGGGPERAIAAVWMIFFELANLGYDLFLRDGHQFAQVDGALASLDLVAGLLLIAIALNANRNYPLFIAAMQLLAISAHLARGLIEAISPIAYITMLVAPGWVLLFFLGIGLLRHRSRLKRHSNYRDWRSPTPLFLSFSPQEEQN